MLIKLSIENYKPFNNLTELSLIQSSKISEHDDHKLSIKDVNILKYASIYGANAAGKSSLIDAVLFFKNVVVNGLVPNMQGMYCRTYKENKAKPSSFEIQFSYRNKIYAYGFSAILSEQAIQSEWLYELQTKGRFKPIFEYDKNSKLTSDYMKKYGLSNNDLDRFKVYTNDFIKYNRTLFLTEMNRGKIINSTSKLIVFKDVFSYIVNNIVVLKPDMTFITSNWFYDETFESINSIMKTLDTGISKIEFRPIDINELEKKIPVDVFLNIKNEVKNAELYQGKQFGNITIHDGKLYIISAQNGKASIYSVKNKHRNCDDEFDYNEESDGTKRMFWLLNLLINKASDMIYFVDELEKSLHPKLTERFIALFNEYHRNDNVQLVLTTHESNIMKLSLFRRDEIWFVDKGISNDSKLYSLDEFKVRYDKAIEKAYLDGRYGAVPIFDDFDFNGER